jgi:gluconolactonase
MTTTRIFLIASLLLFINLKGLTQQPAASDIVAPAATVKEVFSAGEDFLEGVTMSPDGILYFSDFPNSPGTPPFEGIIWTLDPATKAYKIFRSPSGMSNGLKFDANGDLVACEGANTGGRSITRTNMKTGKTTLVAGLYRGRRFNSPNDLAIDQQGRIYFTDPRYLGPESIEQNGMGVYRVDPNGDVHLVAANVAKPNGIVVSPDGKTLYVADCDWPGSGNSGGAFEESTVRPTMAGAVYAFDVNQDGSLKLRSKLIDFGSTAGPDGMTVDTDGNLYIALGNRVAVYAPNGKLITEIKPPRATNLCFGTGAYRKTLFIVGGKSVYMIETKKEGIAPSSKK